MATITGERSGLQEASDLGNYLELKCCAMPAFRDEPRLGIGYFASTALLPVHKYFLSDKIQADCNRWYRSGFIWSRCRSTANYR